MQQQVYPRRILVAVTGLSPQVVTETLYALAVKQQPAFIPTEVHLITTRRGADNARLKLLSDEPGWFHRFCRDYGLTGIGFTAEQVHVIPDCHGAELDDIRDDTDNQAAADFIAEVVRSFTADPDSQIHASIAGGRKTMGYYLGYAMSLYGRPQDRLSHVLVSPPFESHPEFYYPTPRTRVIQTLDRVQDALDTSRAQVWLGDIPFVRLREGLPRELLEGRARFSQAVAEAQRVLPPLELHLDVATCTVRAGGETVRLKPAQFAFYWMLAQRRQQRQPGVHWSDKGLEEELGGYYAAVANPYSGEFERFEASGMSKENFNARKSHINNALRRALGARRAKPYLIAALEPLSDRPRCRPYSLTLPPEVISIPASLPARPESRSERSMSVPGEQARGTESEERA